MPGLLIADDEDMVRSAVRSIISRVNLDVGPLFDARNGEEAVFIARQSRPRIALLDIKMPALNGLEAARIIRQEMPETKIVILTAYDEFSYSQEALRLGAMDYILKPMRPDILIDVLKKALNEIEVEEQNRLRSQHAHSLLSDTLPLVETQLLRSLIQESADTRTVYERIIHYLGKSLSFPVAIVIRPDPAQSGPDGNEQDISSTHALLLEILRRVIPDPQHSLIGQINPGLFVAVVSTDKAFGEINEIKALGNKIRYAIEAGTPFTATVGIGRRYAEVFMLPLSYLEAQRAQWYKLHLGRNTVIHIDDVQSMRLELNSYPVELEKELIESLSTGNQRTSQELMDQLMKVVIGHLPDPPEMILSRLAELVGLISRAVIAAGAPSQETLELAHQQIFVLSKFNEHTDIQGWAQSSLNSFLAKVPSRERGVRVVEQAVGYMRENLTDPDLSLEKVARYVHISPSHLAHLLKEKTGRSYIKYLTYLRMEETKRLLTITDMTMSAIAQAVGYQDATYLHRVFRREHTMTLAAYRQMARKSQNQRQTEYESPGHQLRKFDN